MNHERWWKEPLFHSIQLHHDHLKKTIQDQTHGEKRQALKKLGKRLNKLKNELKASPVDPFLLHRFQAKLVRYQQHYLRWQHQFDKESMENVKIAGEKKHIDEPELTTPLARVPIGKHTLPPLPYAYDALEPYIDTETMHLHHDEHHRKYVEDLNTAELMMEKARQSGNFDLIKHWEREAAFNGAGHYLHTLFWTVMSPDGGGKPHGELLQQIEQDFGSYDKFKQHFSAAAEKVEGSGWAILVWSPRAHRLEILQAEKHQNLSQWDVIPLLALDVWEHAYYLKYPNKRKDYIQNWWNIVYWPEVEKRYNVAIQVLWTPY